MMYGGIELVKGCSVVADFSDSHLLLYKLRSWISACFVLRQPTSIVGKNVRLGKLYG